MARRILVVEDDLLNRMFYCATLEQAGFAVSAVGDGALVLDEVARIQPELVIMDVNLPHVSGIVLTERLKAQADYRDLPILAITAYVGPTEEERIREAGAAGYLSKPVTIAKLLGSIEQLLPAA